LAAVIVGDNPASISHVRMKRNRCAEVGIESRHVLLPAQTTTEQVVRVITELSNDPAVDGILLQHPVPRSHRRAGRLRSDHSREGCRRRHHALPLEDH